MIVVPTGCFNSIDSNSLLNDLVAHWDFEELSGTRFDKISNNHLTDSNGATQEVGKLGNAVRLNNLNFQHLSVGNNSSVSQGNSSFMIAGWLYLTASTGTTQLILIKGGGGTEAEFLLDFSNATSRLRWIVIGASTAFIVNFSTPLNYGQWYFYQLYRDIPGNTAGISLNNSAFETVDATQPGSHTSSPFVFGYQDNTNPRFLNGRLDSTSIWKRLLTPAERNHLWNSGNGRAYPFI